MTTTYEILSMTGRCRSGSDQTGQLYHAVPPGHMFGKALCGKAPGKRGNGWSCYPGQKVTCPACIKKLS